MYVFKEVKTIYNLTQRGIVNKIVHRQHYEC
jgi:hypothetical protein